jgi:hypothetical protein
MEQILSIDANPQPADTVIDHQMCATKQKSNQCDTAMVASSAVSYGLVF